MAKVKPFLDADFLLDNEISALLYHQFAETLPILDYHNHLSPADIAENRQFSTLTEAWLEGDHYKWRAMRANGVGEEFCTGIASARDKFLAWSRTVPYTLRNPLYHWTHLELKNYFGIKDLLSEATAESIYDKSNAILTDGKHGARDLLKQMKVEVVCTTDDPIDSLAHHQAFAQTDASLKMYPSFRPDKAYGLDNAGIYNAYLDQLERTADIQITSYADLINALTKRIDFFATVGCRSADHGLEFLWFSKDGVARAPQHFAKIRRGDQLTNSEKLELRGAILLELGRAYHRVGWVQQFHLGALRNNSTRMLKQVGRDIGFDSIGDFPQIEHMARFFDALDEDQMLARTVLYNLNPSLNEAFATMAGNFNDGITPGKIQYGSGWWFLDQKDGMEKQINTLSNAGLLSRFIGMTTDSRSFLSFPRHEYFRRILCNLIGRDVVNGELPDDLDLLGKTVENICYYNNKQYFSF